jgi:hypothetical protein
MKVRNILFVIAVLFAVVLLTISLYVSIWRHKYFFGLYVLCMSVFAFGCAYVVKTNLKQGLVMLNSLIAIHFASLAILTYYTS